MSVTAPKTWRPAKLRRVDLIFLTIILAITSGFRGFDYVTGDDSGARTPKPGQRSTLVGIESAFPLWVWGILSIAGTIALALGVARSWHFPVWAGHVVLCAMYAALCVGLLPGYFEREWFDGIRSAAGLLLPAVLHGLIWWRMGPRPVDSWGSDVGSA